jgi:hypothetical protein
VYSANNQPEAVDGFYIPAIIYLKDKLQEWSLTHEKNTKT